MATKNNSVSDVTTPGKNGPDATSRPIIVTHGKRLSRDPMVSNTPPAESPSEDVPVEQSKATSTHNKVITPPADTVEVPVDEPKAAEPDPDTADSDDDSTAKSSESAEVQAIADQANVQQKKGSDEEQAKADKVRREHVSQLVASKTYFLPIGRATQKRMLARA